MRFQISFKIHPEDHFTTNAVFIVAADNWEDAAVKASLLKQAMGLNPEQVRQEIIPAHEKDAVIIPGSFHTVHNIGNPTRLVTDELPPLDRTLAIMLSEQRNTVTDDEHPNHFVNTPLDLEQRKAVRETYNYLKRINNKAQGVHRLNSREIEVSMFFSAMFAMPLYLFRDGNWICESVDHTKTCGIGPLPSDAINDFLKSNSINKERVA